jgi:hypothetical protein
MDERLNPAASRGENSLAAKFRNKAYRDAYVASHTRRFLARQMRKFRGEKSQAEFGGMIDKRQTVVSRLEDANSRSPRSLTLLSLSALSIFPHF